MIRWLQRGAIYQVYPRSFQDADGDGVGDLAGVRARLPYLPDLGVDAVWLSPSRPGEPWLPLGDTPSVAEQARDPGSLPALYRRLLALRAGEEALVTGDWSLVRAEDGVLAYTRGGTFHIALDLRGDERALDVPPGDVVLGERDVVIVRLR